MKKSERVWYYGYLLAALRRIWGWSRARRKVLEDSETEKGHRCKVCKKDILPTFKQLKRGTRKMSNVEVDHIIPAVDPVKGRTTWDEFIHRLLDVAVEDLQVLCVPCHQIKTLNEGVIRRETKAAQTNRKRAAA
jgi:hypothetical protein